MSSENDNSFELPELLWRHRSYTAESLLKADTARRIEVELREAALGRTWFSALSSQNDPLDSIPIFSQSRDNEIRKAIKAFQKIHGINVMLSGQKLHEAAREHGETESHFRKQYWDDVKASGISAWARVHSQQVICCFSTRSDSELMWSYYSQSHQSFCYEFKRTSEEVSYSPLWNQVEYRSRPRVSDADYINLATAQLASKNRKSKEVPSHLYESPVREVIRPFKSESWKHECEVRAGFLMKPAGYYDLPEYALNRIILGVNASDELRAKISDVLPETELCQAELNVDSFGLSIPDS